MTREQINFRAELNLGKVFSLTNELIAEGDFIRWMEIPVYTTVDAGSCLIGLSTMGHDVLRIVPGKETQCPQSPS